jgi:hypothetical protein
VYFIHYQPSKIHVRPTRVVSFLSPPWCHLFSGRRHHTTAPCHTSFPLSQDELIASTSFFGNALFYHLTSQAKTEALNLYHRHRLPSSDHPTPTLHCYKMIISTLATLPTTQLRLHFTSSLARVIRLGFPIFRKVQITIDLGGFETHRSSFKSKEMNPAIFAP